MEILSIQRYKLPQDVQRLRHIRKKKQEKLKVRRLTHKVNEIEVHTAKKETQKFRQLGKSLKSSL